MHDLHSLTLPKQSTRILEQVSCECSKAFCSRYNSPSTICYSLAMELIHVKANTDLSQC